MTINTDLNKNPYFDDFDIEKKYYKILFKPGFSVQARELTQLQTTLQNQIEQFGDNIYKDGTIIKGCNFTELKNLSYVKVVDEINSTLNSTLRFRASQFRERTEIGDDFEIEYFYEVHNSGDPNDPDSLKAFIVYADDGFQSREPNLNTFYINYLNTPDSDQKEFIPNDNLTIYEYKITRIRVNNEIVETKEGPFTIATTFVSSLANSIGFSYGLKVSEGVIFQKGYFLYVDEQLVIVRKYMPDNSETIKQPDNVSIGFIVNEDIITSQIDESLLDNANGSPNENAPGADRLRLTPVLVAIPTNEVDDESTFFTLIRYENGNAVQIRDVSEFNSIATEMARRTFEESGDYYVRKIEIESVRRDGDINVSIGPGIVYAKGYRVENRAERFFAIDDIEQTKVQQNQPVSIDYGGYVDIIAPTGNFIVDTFEQVDLRNSNNTVTIGKAVVKNFTKERLYLFAIKMLTSNTSFSDVGYVRGSSGAVQINPIIRKPSRSSLIFDTGSYSIKSIQNSSVQVRTRRNNVTAVANVITLGPNIGETFNAFSLLDVVVIDNVNQNINATPSLVGNNLQISIAGGGTSPFTVYYNSQISIPNATYKQALTVFVRINYSDLVSRYTLGLPDVYKIISIKDTNDTDFVNSFKLYTNQKDDFYDHSFIEHIRGRPLPDNGELLVELKVFRPISSNINFYTADSYIDVDQFEVPFFDSSSGKTFTLHDCIDFRPHRTAVASYALTSGAATLITDNNIDIPTSNMFSAAPYIVPGVNTNVVSDIEFYLNRTDTICVDAYGSFSLVKGEEGVNSVPKKIEGKTPIAEVFIPGNPVLTQDEAIDTNRQKYAVKINHILPKNYTMKDIGVIEKKIDRLEYYTTLSLLESATQNLLIQDENGLNRFKNGIIVEPFNDLSIANLEDATFKASIDFTEKSLNPAQFMFPIELDVLSTNGTQLDSNGTSITLSKQSSRKIIDQFHVTGFRLCVSNFYNYIGNGFITPTYDVSYDTVTNPKQVTIDITTPITNLVSNLQEFIPLTSTSTEILSKDVTESNTSQTRGRNGGITNTTTVTTKEIIEKTIRGFQISNKTTEQKVGEFVSNIEFKPYMRSRDITIAAFGLRPNTRHYFFFDKVDVNIHVAPGRITSSNKVIRIGNAGEEVRTDSQGRLYAVFKIPESTFFVGDRSLVITDVSSYNDIESGATSRCFLTYHSYNFSQEKTSLTLSTREPEFSISTLKQVETNTNVSTRTNIIREPNLIESDRDNNYSDPIAQTFFIKQSMSSGADSIFISRLDLYFKRKSSVNGITVMIREVINGYPSRQIVPFSKIHLNSSQVQVSEKGNIATSIFFETPVRLQTEKEYCFVVEPDAADPDYLIFTSKIGGTDLITGFPITQDMFDGMLFTSTNNRSWKSYQDEDIKFALYQQIFSTETGTAVLKNDNHEFISLSDVIGKFETNEIVYAIKPVSTFNISITKGISTFTTSTNISSFVNVNDYILVVSNTNVKNLLKIISEPILSNGLYTVQLENAPTFSRSNFPANLVVAGSVCYFNPSRKETLILDKSSARLGNIFETNDQLIGLSSGTIATIGSIDNIELSYIQLMLDKTASTLESINVTSQLYDEITDQNYITEVFTNKSKRFNERPAYIKSKSNDLNGTNNLRFTLSLSNNGVSTVSPFVDYETSRVFAYVYDITNNSDTTSRYISKTVNLIDGFDSEDLRLYLSAYKPTGTDIKVYARFKSNQDALSIESNDWIELNMIEGLNVFSSTININDFREYVYEIPDSFKNDGILVYSNVTGTFEKFQAFSIRIDLLSDSKGSVPRLLDYRGIAFE